MLETPSPYLKRTVAMIVEGYHEKVRPYFRNLSPEDVIDKGNRTTAAGDVEKDFVTIADNGMEDFVTNKLAISDPDAILVGEEGSEKNNERLANLRLGRKPTLDGVDGTSMFRAGKAGCGVLFADQTDGVTVAAILLRIVDTADGGFDVEIIMGDNESGMWFSPGQGKDFVRVKPFAERAERSKDAIPSGIVTARYFNPGLLRHEQEILTALRNPGDVFETAALKLKESDSSVNYWFDLILGKIDFISATATRPWDINAGAKAVQLLGGMVVSLDTGKNYMPWRIDGGIFAAANADTGNKIQKDLFTTGTAPMGQEPCRWSLLLDATKQRLMAEVAQPGSTPFAADMQP